MILFDVNKWQLEMKIGGNWRLNSSNFHSSNSCFFLVLAATSLVLVSSFQQHHLGLRVNGASSRHLIAPSLLHRLDGIHFSSSSSVALRPGTLPRILSASRSPPRCPSGDASSQLHSSRMRRESFEAQRSRRCFRDADLDLKIIKRHFQRLSLYHHHF